MPQEAKRYGQRDQERVATQLSYETTNISNQRELEMLERLEAKVKEVILSEAKKGFKLGEADQTALIEILVWQRPARIKLAYELGNLFNLGGELPVSYLTEQQLSISEQKRLVNTVCQLAILKELLEPPARNYFIEYLLKRPDLDLLNLTTAEALQVFSNNAERWLNEYYCDEYRNNLNKDIENGDVEATRPTEIKGISTVMKLAKSAVTKMIRLGEQGVNKTMFDGTRFTVTVDNIQSQEPRLKTWFSQMLTFVAEKYRPVVGSGSENHLSLVYDKLFRNKEDLAQKQGKFGEFLADRLLALKQLYPDVVLHSIKFKSKYSNYSDVTLYLKIPTTYRDARNDQEKSAVIPLEIQFNSEAALSVKNTETPYFNERKSIETQIKSNADFQQVWSNINPDILFGLAMEMGRDKLYKVKKEEWLHDIPDFLLEHLLIRSFNQKTATALSPEIYKEFTKRKVSYSSLPDNFKLRLVADYNFHNPTKAIEVPKNSEDTKLVEQCLNHPFLLHYYKDLNLAWLVHYLAKAYRVALKESQQMYQVGAFMQSQQDAEYIARTIINNVNLQGEFDFASSLEHAFEYDIHHIEEHML